MGRCGFVGKAASLRGIVFDQHYLPLVYELAISEGNMEKSNRRWSVVLLCIPSIVSAS